MFFDETGGKVRYQYGKGRAEEEWMDYLEFIARVTSHIPDKGQVMIRYYGLYSNAHRGKMRKTHEAANPFLIIEQEEPFVPSKGWAEMIRKVYEVDIRHLKLTFMAERPPPPQSVQKELRMAVEERGEYF